MAIHIYTYHDSVTNWGPQFCSEIAELGITATYASSNITITSWEGHPNITNQTFLATKASSNTTYFYVVAVRDTLDKEAIIVSTGYDYTKLNSYTYTTCLLNNNNEIYGTASTAYTYSMWPVVLGIYDNKENIAISKIVSANFTDNDTTVIKDISASDLYSANAFLSPRVIYTDAAGDKFIAINQWMLMKYEE